MNFIRLGWMVDWLIEPLLDWLIEYSIDWLVDWPNGWSVDRLIDWLVLSRSIDWLIDWCLVGRSIDWLILGFGLVLPTLFNGIHSPSSSSTTSIASLRIASATRPAIVKSQCRRSWYFKRVYSVKTSWILGNIFLGLTWKRGSNASKPKWTKPSRNRPVCLVLLP